MTNDPLVQRVIVDLRRNALVLELDRALPEEVTTTGTMDIGALGRLIGAEVGGIYLAISDPVPGSELQGRSVELAMAVDVDRQRVTIPRRGPTWELSFPSGNQCWNRRDTNGRVHALCAVIASG